MLRAQEVHRKSGKTLVLALSFDSIHCARVPTENPPTACPSLPFLGRTASPASRVLQARARPLPNIILASIDEAHDVPRRKNRMQHVLVSTRPPSEIPEPSPGVVGSLLKKSLIFPSFCQPDSLPCLEPLTNSSSSPPSIPVRHFSATPMPHRQPSFPFRSAPSIAASRPPSPKFYGALIHSPRQHRRNARHPNSA